LSGDGGCGGVLDAGHDVRQCLFCDFLMLHDSVSVETGFFYANATKMMRSWQCGLEALAIETVFWY
jgi:hypothetical protein